MIVFCCQRGCGECNLIEGKSECCGENIFKWDTEYGVIVTDPE